MIEGKYYKIENGHLTIFDGVTNIDDFAFSKNKLISIYIPQTVTIIKSNAFSCNQLNSLKIPGNVKIIGQAAFGRNKLTQVIIEKGVTCIEASAFLYNSLTKVEIPGSVTKIGKKAFDNIDVVYNGVLIPKDYIEKYGCENIIKLYEASKIVPLEKIYKITSKSVFDTIPLTNDALKGYILNKKNIDDILDDKIIEEIILYDELENEILEECEIYKSIFKLCFALGLFTKPTEELKNFIKRILKDKTLDYIHNMWFETNLTVYKPKFADLFIKLYDEDKLEYKNQNIIGILYSEFELIKDFTIKKHDLEIKDKNVRIKRLKEIGANTFYLEQELETLKRNEKRINYDDIIYYINHDIFKVRQGNEQLLSIVSQLPVNMNQTNFNEIQDIYEESKGVEKSFIFTKDSGEYDIKYHWSKSDDPVNIILGYIVGCCSVLGGKGEDVMRQSMINPNVANLILYDENNNIIGKATAYYNREKKYILFNTIKTKYLRTKGLKSAEKRRRECLEALIRATNDVIIAMKEQGNDIREVRVGVLENDLEGAIIQSGLEIGYDLLEPYAWENYDGDASIQAILYQNDELGKEKNI